MSGTYLVLVLSPASYMGNCPSLGCSSLWTSWELSLAILMLFHGVSGENMKAGRQRLSLFTTNSFCICNHESTERQTRGRQDWLGQEASSSCSVTLQS